MAAKAKKRYRLKGEIEKIDPIFDEYAWAYSEPQAKLIVHRRMDKKYPHRKNFILWKSVEEVRKKLSKILPPKQFALPLKRRR